MPNYPAIKQSPSPILYLLSSTYPLQALILNMSFLPTFTNLSSLRTLHKYYLWLPSFLALFRRLSTFLSTVMHFSTSALALTAIAFASALPATIPSYPLPTTSGCANPPGCNPPCSPPAEPVDPSRGPKEASIIIPTFTSLYDV